MTIQYEMKKCITCETYFWKRHIKNDKCPYCIDKPENKSIVSKEENVKEEEKKNES